MSGNIGLSQELITELLSSITKHDAEAKEDMMVNIQYLVAVAGYLAADFPGPDSEREELLDHLAAFMKHVCDDRVQSEGAPQAAAEPAAAPVPAGKSVATDSPAVGIWKPE